MQSIFEAINGVFGFIGPLSDFLWDFPTNFEWYRNIPLLGNFSLAIILLLGSGIFFSFKLGFMQVTHFKKGVHILTEKKGSGNRYFTAGSLSFKFSHACGTGQYHWCYRRHRSRRSGRAVLDVGFCIFRYGGSLYGKCAGTDL